MSEDYGQGYAAGKAKAHFEIRTLHGAGHVEGCNCEPCITVAVVLEAHYQAGLKNWQAKRIKGNRLGNVHLPDPETWAEILRIRESQGGSQPRLLGSPRIEFQEAGRPTAWSRGGDAR